MFCYDRKRDAKQNFQYSLRPRQSRYKIEKKCNYTLNACICQTRNMNITRWYYSTCLWIDFIQIDNLHVIQCEINSQWQRTKRSQMDSIVWPQNSFRSVNTECEISIVDEIVYATACSMLHFSHGSLINTLCFVCFWCDIIRVYIIDRAL